MRRFLEDFEAGEVIQLGRTVAEEEPMIEFARRYDPQPFHVDEAAGRESHFGALIASGWYTAGLFMRLFADRVLIPAASLGSPGVEEMRWLRPVRPGDRLAGRYEVLEVSPSSRHPLRGTVRARGELLDREGRVVFRLIARNHFARREAGAAGGGAGGS